MNDTILVLDTETAGSLDKPFCYNLGYIIYDPTAEQPVLKRDFVVEQVWHNAPLFESAYYADKRPQYVAAMRARKTIMDKYGYIMRQMIRDIRDRNVRAVYAFNSDFDDKVIAFNSDYYHCSNALDTLPVFDIRGYACKYLLTDKYKDYCNAHESDRNAHGDRKFVTDNDGYRTTAESFYSYITNREFDEAHTALADCEIELEILLTCIAEGGKWEERYPTAKAYARNTPKHYKLNLFGEITEGDATAIFVRKTKNGTCITLK